MYVRFVLSGFAERDGSRTSRGWLVQDIVAQQLTSFYYGNNAGWLIVICEGVEGRDAETRERRLSRC